MGPHFGTRQAALQRLGHYIQDYDYTGRSFVIKVNVQIKNPVIMRDVHFDEYGTMVEDLIDKRYLTIDELPIPWGERYSDEVSEKLKLERLIGVLKEKGYDGIVYENRIEDPGSTSVIPFSLRQIQIIKVWEI